MWGLDGNNNIKDLVAQRRLSNNSALPTANSWLSRNMWGLGRSNNTNDIVAQRLNGDTNASFPVNPVNTAIPATPTSALPINDAIGANQIGDKDYMDKLAAKGFKDIDHGQTYTANVQALPPMANGLDADAIRNSLNSGIPKPVAPVMDKGMTLEDIISQAKDALSYRGDSSKGWGGGGTSYAMSAPKFFGDTRDGMMQDALESNKANKMNRNLTSIIDSALPHILSQPGQKYSSDTARYASDMGDVNNERTVMGGALSHAMTLDPNNPIHAADVIYKTKHGNYMEDLGQKALSIADQKASAGDLATKNNAEKAYSSYLSKNPGDYEGANRAMQDIKNFGAGGTYFTGDPAVKGSALPTWLGGTAPVAAQPGHYGTPGDSSAPTQAFVNRFPSLDAAKKAWANGVR